MAALTGTAFGADGRLGTAKLQKAAVDCQKLIAGASAKVVAGKFAALDACLNVALGCVHTQQAKDDCFAKAGKACATKLRKASDAVTKAATKVATAKSCAGTLRLPDLLSADGLGFGASAGLCALELGLDVCASVDALATCIMRTHERGATGLYGFARPRAAELLALSSDVAVPPGSDGLPVFGGCSMCSVAALDRKPVEECGVALTKAASGLIAALVSQFAGCAQPALGCAQIKPGDAKCLGKATKQCAKAAEKLPGLMQKLANVVAKKCSGDVVDFGLLRDPSGLNLAALASQCPGGLTDPATVASCLQQRIRCRIAELARRAIPRLDELATAGAVAPLGGDLTAVCPAVTAPTIANAGRQARVTFGSLTKFMRSVRRPSAGVFGIRTGGGRPASTGGLGAGVTALNGPTRVTFGGHTKIPFRYRRSLARGRSATATEAGDVPMLIVTVRRDDLTFDDHFEVALDASPTAETEVEDELEIEYQDDASFPGCAFTLEFATRIGEVVSDYTPLLQVVDAAMTPTPVATPTGPTPTTTPTPVPTPSTTASPTPPPASCPIGLEIFGGSGAPAMLDLGWIGFAHDSTLVQDGKLTLAVDCASETPPCGVCNLLGPISNTNAGAGDIASQRCTSDLSIKCTDGSQCIAGGGTCQFFLGAPLPLSAGGIGTCVTNQVAGSIVGTTNVESGAFETVVNLTSRVYTGIPAEQPCPVCGTGAGTPNDGVTDGTCSTGARAGQQCDINGRSPTSAFGNTSFDCPPNPGGLLSTLAVALAGSNGTETRTLADASPTCTGDDIKKCFCPPGGPEPTRPNDCFDVICTDQGNGEGACQEGPIDQVCAIETFRGCLDSSDCPASGDSCIGRPRACYTDNGVVGASVSVAGAVDPPDAEGLSNPTFAALFCVPPVGTSAAVNRAYGLPGLGRLRLPLAVRQIFP